MILVALAAAAAIAMPTCEGKDDCAVKWGRATQWVMARNANIAQQTDTFLATMRVEETGRDYFQLMRIPTSADGYTIDLRIGCANEFRCRWQTMKTDFTDAVMSHTDPARPTK